VLNSKIKSIEAKEILDSRKIPTIETKILTDFGVFYASVPSGTSRGKFEAVEIRNKDGKGVKKAIENIEKIIAPALENEDPTDQKRIDEILINLDGTKNKSRLGVNAILPVSIVMCRAGATAKKVPLYTHISQIAENSLPRTIRARRGLVRGSLPILPSPSLLLIEGGKHAENQLNLQEFMIVPEGESFEEKFRKGKEVYRNLGLILEKEYGKKSTRAGLEGAFTVPSLKRTKEAMDLITKVIRESGQENQIKIAIDSAASSFFNGEKYDFEGEKLTREELSDFYSGLCEKYPIISIEDPFAEEDWKGWAMLNCKMQTANCKLLIIGDDLTVTNPERIREAKKKKACNAVIIKPNQIGTVTETIEAAKLAKSYGWKLVVSHRSGETIDDFIADLAVGLGADFIKSGAPAPKERMVKYGRLLEIEEEIHLAS